MPRLTNVKSRKEMKQLATSMKELQNFVAHQKQWLPKANHALKDDYAIEAMYLCTNQIHAVLRKSLWIKGQLEFLAQRKKMGDDAQLFKILSHSSDMMPRGVPDKELYGAAAKFNIITQKEGRRLSQLREDASVTLRDCLDGSASPKTLVKIAKEFILLNKNCVRTLEDLSAKVIAKLQSIA